MKGTEYSPYKCFYHLDSLNAGRPVLAYWLITHRCNYNCPVCFNKHNPDFVATAESSVGEICDYAEQLKALGVKALSIQGGEPLLHSQIETVLAGLLSMGFEIGMISNGSLITQELIPLLSRLTWFRISVDGMSRATYGNVHGIRVFPGNPAAELWDMFRAVVPAIKANGCVVGSSFLVQDTNVQEMFDFAAWSKVAGFDTCRYSYVREPDGTMKLFSPGQHDGIEGQLESALLLQDENFKVFGLTDRLALSSGKPYSHCYMSDLFLALCADGKVYRCCSYQNNNAGLLGDLNETSLEEIWHNRGEQDLSTCPMCWQDKKNGFLSYMMTEEKRHINFV
jgi:MoaA/NifB/PqqE/SkfB family radical SAM enzyme